MKSVKFGSAAVAMVLIWQTGSAFAQGFDPSKFDSDYFFRWKVPGIKSEDAPADPPEEPEEPEEPSSPPYEYLDESELGAVCSNFSSEGSVSANTNFTVSTLTYAGFEACSSFMKLRVVVRENGTYGVSGEVNYMPFNTAITPSESGTTHPVSFGGMTLVVTFYPDEYRVNFNQSYNYKYYR